MKTTRWIALVLCCVLLCGWMAACETAKQQEQKYDVVFDMDEYAFFSEVFGAGQWEDKGTYTVLLNGLPTPVLVEMDGLTVKAVNAYGKRLALEQDAYQGSVGIEIEAVEGVLVIYQNADYEKNCWLLTQERSYHLPVQDGYSTTVHVRDDGTLRYRRSWCEYDTTFHQDVYAPLYCCTSREHMLYQEGSVAFVDSELVLTPEKTVTVGEEYDLEAMFTEAKMCENVGEYFSRFETVDQVLAANENR